MNSKKKFSRRVTLVVALLVGGLIVVNGCKKSEPEPATPVVTTQPATPTMDNVAEKAAKTAAETTEAAEETMDKAMKTVEQTTCPIMDGNKINKDIFVEYKGKKVYFCCPDCKAKFDADPEKYIAKLPQFQEE